MLGGRRRRRRRGRTAGVSWMLQKALGWFLLLWDVSHLAFTITTHPVPVLCMTPPLHLLSIMPADQTPQPHSTSVVVTSRPIQHDHFTPPTEHQSAGFPMSWSSLFLLSDLPPHLHSFTLVNGLSRGRESSDAYEEKACGIHEIKEIKKPKQQPQKSHRDKVRSIYWDIDTIFIFLPLYTTKMDLQ